MFQKHGFAQSNSCCWIHSDNEAIKAAFNYSSWCFTYILALKFALRDCSTCQMTIAAQTCSRSQSFHTMVKTSLVQTKLCLLLMLDSKPLTSTSYLSAFVQWLCAYGFVDHWVILCHPCSSNMQVIARRSFFMYLACKFSKYHCSSPTHTIIFTSQCPEFFKHMMSCFSFRGLPQTCRYSFYCGCGLECSILAWPFDMLVSPLQIVILCVHCSCKAVVSGAIYA